MKFPVAKMPPFLIDHCPALPIVSSLNKNFDNFLDIFGGLQRSCFLFRLRWPNKSASSSPAAIGSRITTPQRFRQQRLHVSISLLL